MLSIHGKSQYSSFLCLLTLVRHRSAVPPAFPLLFQQQLPLLPYLRKFESTHTASQCVVVNPLRCPAGRYQGG